MIQSEKRLSGDSEVRGSHVNEELENSFNKTVNSVKTTSNNPNSKNTENNLKLDQLSIANNFSIKLEEFILTMVKDISAKTMAEIMTKNKDSEDAITHIITIKPNSEPIKQKTRGIPQAFRDEFKKTLMEMKEAGMIVDSKSPWCSPVRLVKKPDGSIRVCVDFRKVNNVTVKDSFPIPKIEDIFSHLAKAKIFSTIDMTSGYYQVKMDKDSMPYTAFASQWGFYEYVVMPMGLTNACATFQRLMNMVLDGYIGDFCLVYLDDIIIYSENEEDHLKHVQQVVERLRKHNLKIKLSKCKFARKKIEYLSHVIENGTITPNPQKVEAVNNTIKPKNVKQVQSFLGLVSYYRKFIKNCSTIASPLIKLTEKNEKFNWTNECEDAFNTLKSYLGSQDHVLALPDFNKMFVIECDASKYGIGGVLSQKTGKHFQPVAFFSKHLSKTERNYSTSERELLAIVLSVEHFKQFVYGREFKIITDHEPLKYLATVDAPAPRLARLQKRLNINNQTIEYRSGKLNGNADALSRMVDEEIEDNSETDETLVINAMYLSNNKPNKDQYEDKNLNWIIKLLKENSNRPIIETFENLERKSLYKQWSRLKIFNNTLFREYTNLENDTIHYQYVVPKLQREFILSNNHNTVVCGHLGYH